MQYVLPMSSHAPTHVNLSPDRFLAQSAEARGDLATARRLYEGIVGREACGRSGALAGSWAHAGYGWMMLQEGEAEVSSAHIAFQEVTSGTITTAV